MTNRNRGGATQPGVFICYRREDSAGEALRVYTLLSAKFGEDRVFMDVTIPAATDFMSWIEDRIGAAGVVVPIIGREWLAVDTTTGRPRIEDPEDVLRSEIVRPLKRGMHVLPVLVDGAKMPGKDDLPSDLAPLAFKQGHDLRTDAYWSASNDKLVERVADLLGTMPLTAQPPPPQPSRSRRVPPSVMTTGILGVLLLAAGLIVLKDVYITPPFRFLAIEPGIFTAVAPLGVLGGAILSMWRVRRAGGADWLDAGLLAGFGLAAAAKGVSLLAESAGRIQAGGMIWAIGGALIGVAGILTAAHLSKLALAEPQHGSGGAAALVAVLGASMLVVGAVIPFNVALGTETRSVVSDSWAGADPIGIALAILVAVGLLVAGRRRLAAGLLLAFGFTAMLLWVRYIGIPVAQWLHTDGIASPRLGGLIGLAGGLLVFGTGWRLALSRRTDVSVPAPMPSP